MGAYWIQFPDTQSDYFDHVRSLIYDCLAINWTCILLFMLAGGACVLLPLVYKFSSAKIDSVCYLGLVQVFLSLVLLNVIGDLFFKGARVVTYLATNQLLMTIEPLVSFIWNVSIGILVSLLMVGCYRAGVRGLHERVVTLHSEMGQIPMHPWSEVSVDL